MNQSDLNNGQNIPTRDIIEVSNMVGYNKPLEVIRETLLGKGYSEYGAWLCYHAGKTYFEMGRRDTASFANNGDDK